MKKLIALGIIATTFSFGTMAAMDEVTYSNEEYCIIADTHGTDSVEATSYLRKIRSLGLIKPSAATCKHFVDAEDAKKASFTPKKWDYRKGMPYPGSVLRLSASTLNKLKALQKQTENQS